MYNKPKLLHNTFYLTASQVSGRLVRFVYLLVIARLLGPEETGIYLYGLALYLGVIGIGQFGQHTFLAQRVGKHTRIPNSVLHHSLTLSLLATVAAMGVLTVFVWMSESEPILRLTILCFVAALMARVLAEWVRVAYVAFERPNWVPGYEITFRGSEALFGVFALLSGGGLLAISFLHFFFWALEAGFALRKLAREYPGALAFGWRPGYLKKAASVSMVFFVSFTAFALFFQIAIILLRKLQPDSVLVGEFGIAMQFFGAMMIGPLAATQAFLPRLSRSFARGGSGQDLITAVKLVGLLALSVAIIAAAYGPWFITLALGSEYVEVVVLFRWLCWVFTPCAIVALLGQCFSVIGGRRTAATIMTGMSTLHACLLIAYVDQSAAIAAVGSMLVAAIAGMLVAVHQIGLILGHSEKGWWMKTLLVTMTTYAVFESGWASLMFTAPVALVVGGLLTHLLKVFNPDDISAIRRLLGRAT